jgi:putative ABC transport system ATP-binding protein
MSEPNLVGSIGSPFVELRDVSKQYSGPPMVCALRPCTLQIIEGDYVAVTGASGSGKTTLLSMLGLLDRPTSGTYCLDGDDVATMSDKDLSSVRAHKIGFVFQAFHLIGHRSVKDNVGMGLLYQGIRRRQVRTRVEQIVKDVGLWHRKDSPCSVLSGGERQRVAIGRALIREPRLLLCDEPTGNLDSATADQILLLLSRFNQRGQTLVVITHNPEVAAHASRQLSILDGVVTETVPCR